MTELPGPSASASIPGDQRVGGRAKHVLEAASDFADEIAYAYALDTPEVDHAHAGIARVRG